MPDQKRDNGAINCAVTGVKTPDHQAFYSLPFPATDDRYPVAPHHFHWHTGLQDFTNNLSEDFRVITRRFEIFLNVVADDGVLHVCSPEILHSLIIKLSRGQA
jgi:hypothetical protein